MKAAEVEAAKVGDVVADLLAARPSVKAAEVEAAKVGDVLAARPSSGGERAPCPRGCISRRPTPPPGIARPGRRASLRANVTGTINFNGIA